MPYYQCPKCGGRDTYHGTELVSGGRGGGAIIGPENDMGFSPVVGVSGGSRAQEQTVVKCKTCDIILGEKDRHLTPDETEQRAKEYKAARRHKKCWWGFAITTVPICILSMILAESIWDYRTSQIYDTMLFVMPSIGLVLNGLIWRAVYYNPSSQARTPRGG